MADKYPALERGTIGAEGVVVDAISNGAIAMWAPVISVAGAITNFLPRVATTTTANDPAAIGVVVGGVTDGGTGGNAVDAANKACQLALFGRCKVRVDGATVNIAVSDPLTTSTVAGRAIKAANLPSTYDSTARRNIIGYALAASTLDGDYIPMLVVRNG